MEKLNRMLVSLSITVFDRDTEGDVPVAIVEAPASGMPVLSTAYCDIPEVMIDKGSGYLVSEREIGALAEKLEFLVLNPNIWKEMGLKSIRYIKKNIIFIMK